MYLIDWLDLALRWLHVIAGVVWIGASVLLVALDNHLKPPRQEDADAGVGGEAWEVHGGGFYLVQKFTVAPKTLPGVIAVVWLGGAHDVALASRLLRPLLRRRRSQPRLRRHVRAAAIAISLALLAAAWLVYDALCRVIRNEAALAAVLVAPVTASAYGLSPTPTARFGSNWEPCWGRSWCSVFVIILAQLGLRPGEAGWTGAGSGTGDTRQAAHNNYPTLPVLVAMLATTSRSPTGNTDGWLVLVPDARRRLDPPSSSTSATRAALCGGYRSRRRRRWRRSRCGSAAGRQLHERPPVTFADVAPIVEQRCATCHYEPAAPKGVRLEILEQIAAQAAAIERVAVLTRVMPLDNTTQTTDAEREPLGRWSGQGAETGVGSGRAEDHRRLLRAHGAAGGRSCSEHRRCLPPPAPTRPRS